MRQSSQPVSFVAERPNQGHCGAQGTAEISRPFLANNFHQDRALEIRPAVHETSSGGAQSTVSGTERSVLSCASLCSGTIVGTHSESQYENCFGQEHASDQDADLGIFGSLFTHAQVDDLRAADAQSGAPYYCVGSFLEQVDKQGAYASSSSSSSSSFEQYPVQDAKIFTPIHFPTTFDPSIEENVQGVLDETPRTSLIGAAGGYEITSHEIKIEHGNWEARLGPASDDINDAADDWSSPCSTPGDPSWLYPCTEDHLYTNARRHSFGGQSPRTPYWDLGGLQSALEPAASTIVNLSAESSGAGYVEVTAGNEAGRASSLPVASSSAKGQRPRAPRKRSSSKNEGGDDPNRKRPRKTKDDATSISGPKFACPYAKIYNLYCWDCSPKPENSSAGSYKNFTQVKIHVQKCHVVSKRCRCCWTRLKGRHAICLPKTYPYPVLLTEEMEAAVKAKRFNGDDETKWRNLTSILLPGLSQTELMSTDPFHDPTATANDPLIAVAPAVPPVALDSSDGATTSEGRLSVISAESSTGRGEEPPSWATQLKPAAQCVTTLSAFVNLDFELILRGNPAAELTTGSTTGASNSASMQQQSDASDTSPGQATRRAMGLLEGVRQRHRKNMELLRPGLLQGGRYVEQTRGASGGGVNAPVHAADLPVAYQNMQVISDALDFLVDFLRGAAHMDVNVGEEILNAR